MGKHGELRKMPDNEILQEKCVALIQKNDGWDCYISNLDHGYELELPSMILVRVIKQAKKSMDNVKLIHEIILLNLQALQPMDA